MPKLIDVFTEYEETIGRHIQIYPSNDIHLSMHDALEAFRNGRFSSSNSSVINFGIGSESKWLAVQVRNSENTSIHRNLLFETSWLDKIDVYFLQEDQLVNSDNCWRQLVIF